MEKNLIDYVQYELFCQINKFFLGKIVKTISIIPNLCAIQIFFTCQGILCGVIVVNVYN